MLTLIIADALPSTRLAWTLYGLGSAVNVLGFTVLGEGFPRELTARANTALNLILFTTSFALQWGIGVVADLSKAWLRVDSAGGLRIAFILVAVLQALAYTWFVFGWRRYATRAAMTGFAA